MGKQQLTVKTYIGVGEKDYIEATLSRKEDDDENIITLAIGTWEKDEYYISRKIRKIQENPKKIYKKRFRLPSYSLLYAFMLSQLEEFAGVNDLSQLDDVSWKTVTAAKKKGKDPEVTEKDHFSFPSSWTEPFSYVTARARQVQRKALEDETFMKNLTILNFIQEGGKNGRSLNSISKFLNKDKKGTREILDKLIKKRYLRQDNRGWYHVIRVPQSMDDLHLLHQDLLYIYIDPYLRLALGVLLGALFAEMYWTWWPREGKVLQTQFDGRGNIVSETLIESPYDEMNFEKIAQELAEQATNVAYLVDDASKDPFVFITNEKLRQSVDVAVASIEFHYGVISLYSVISRPIFAGVKCTKCSLHFVVFPYPEEITKVIMGEDMAYTHNEPGEPAFTAESLDMDNVKCLCGTTKPELVQRPLHGVVPEKLEAAVEEAHRKYDDFLQSADLDLLKSVAEYHRPFLKIATETT